MRNGRSNCSGAVDGILVADGLTILHHVLRPGAEDAMSWCSVQKLRMVTVQGTLVQPTRKNDGGHIRRSFPSMATLDAWGIKSLTLRKTPCESFLGMTLNPVQLWPFTSYNWF